MAWSIGDYNEFLSEAQDTFGLDRGEAQDLYVDMRDALGFSLTVNDLYDYGDMASDLVEEVEVIELVVSYDVIDTEEYADVPRAELPTLAYDDEYDFYDEWLEPGDEIEITAEVGYEERE